MLVDSKNKINYLIKVDCVKIALRIVIVGGDSMCLIACFLWGMVIFCLMIGLSDIFSLGMSFLLAIPISVIMIAFVSFVGNFISNNWDDKNK